MKLSISRFDRTYEPVGYTTEKPEVRIQNPEFRILNFISNIRHLTHKWATILFLTALWIILGFPSAHAQFIHFSMEVEPELSTDVVQRLDFGMLPPNPGPVQIEKGSPDMGIFQIRGLNNQHVLVTLDTPEFLTGSNPEINDRIPISLEASYSNKGIDDVHSARPFTGRKAWFQIGDPGADTAQWESAYVYVYGNLQVGEARKGIYTAILVLNIEYQ